MIVNPQVFNYRFTIGTLIIAFSALSIFSFTSYNNAESEKEFLKQEKKLLENQISEIISSYDKLGEVNENLASQLSQTKVLVEKANNSVIQLKADLSLLPKYRNELMFLKEQKLDLVKKGDSFLKVNEILLKENTFNAQVIDKQESRISNLEKENNNLENELKKGTVVTANSFDAAAYSLKGSGEIIEINKANKAKNIRVAFVLAKNDLVPVEEKELYIQVIGPDNNIVADKGAVHFGESTLIYSSKIKVDYTKEALEVCTNVKTEEPLKAGRYYVSVFEKNRRLGGTQIDLY